MRKQAIRISINELRKLADELESQVKQFDAELGDIRFQINIINKTGDSDGWEIEKDSIEENKVGKVKIKWWGRSY